MLFRDKNFLFELENELLQLKNISPSCDECLSYSEAVDNLFTTYKKSDSIANNLKVTGNGIDEVTGKIARLERQRISSFLTLTQRLLLIVGALLCTLGPLFVYKTAAYIVTPIKRLVNITKKISEGDITLRAPFKEQDETYQLAVSFNTMLDNLYQTQQSLEKSMELLREKQSQLVEAEKLATIGTVSSGIAHEINNPLQNIYLAAQILSEQETSSNIVKEAVKDIFSQTLRVKRIVNELLEFAREKTPELKNIHILDVINNALKMIKLPDEISDIKYNIECSEDVYVYADGHQLVQVFINLFTNAMDAMEESGLLNVRIDTTDNSVQIKISDTGNGIAPQDIPDIFDPFHTTKGSGTGLGLAIVQCIIAKNKGNIEVTSELNKGTTFKIALKHLSYKLENDGHAVTGVSNGLDALKQVEKEAFDILIADIKMPGMDGIALLAEVKAKSPDIEVIIVTGFGSIESAVDAMKKGACDYITKPFSLDELNLKIAKIMENKRLRDENIALKASLGLNKDM
jgi:signal transduction histidine kinase